jgi:putative transposase-like DNA-binding protein/resolvase-like protein
MVGEPVTSTTAETGQTVVYARVSSADQITDLDRQVARVTVWATGQKLGVDRVVTEVGSALNGHGAALTAQGRRLLVVDPVEVDDDLVRDVTEILTLLCARLWYPSSKTCSGCGAAKAKLALSEREYHCEACGLVMDRDRNAALNLAALAAEFDTAGSGPVAGRGADQKTNRALTQAH